MKIFEKLASSLGRRDEVPNQELAKEIAAGKDRHAVKELFEGLENKSRDIQNDCIKVIYEVGNVDPKLIAGYHAQLLKLLYSKNNRLQWGAMHALNTIALENPGIIYKSLPQLADAAGKGTVITKDNFMWILIKLCSVPKYAE